jgi:hypothetical protein
MYESHIYQPALAIWIFHQVVPSLVLKTVGAICRVHRAFKAFDDPDRNLDQFVKHRTFPRCDHFLMSCPRGIEPRLTWPDIRRPLSTWVAWVPSHCGYSGFSQITPGLVLFGHTAHGLTTRACGAVRYEFWMLIESCIPPSLFPSKCPGCKMLQSSSPAMRSFPLYETNMST